METKILNILFLSLIAMMVVLFAAIVVISAFETEETGQEGLKSITGAVQNFEVYHEAAGGQYIPIKTSERFDGKYFEHLESMQEARENTFQKGRVFLREK